MSYRAQPFDKLLARVLRLSNGRLYIYLLLQGAVILAAIGLSNLKVSVTGKVIILIGINLFALYLCKRAYDLPKKMWWYLYEGRGGPRYYPLLFRGHLDNDQDYRRIVNDDLAIQIERELAERTFWASLKKFIKRPTNG
ncbi:hypothetical protein [Sphingobium sp. Sx8-8]|uniref:hypothetical protein n=1 Tax=Sphingobium sp. Sx8-8 TaxID=2933617 RepID=UPI001F5875C7|nr:hypothetical protein [Sphingobium sp. Sx8-8]